MKKKNFTYYKILGFYQNLYDVELCSQMIKLLIKVLRDLNNKTISKYDYFTDIMDFFFLKKKKIKREKAN
jgi:hypothetical protein